MSATLDLAALFGTQQVFVIEHEDQLLHLITCDHMLQWNRAYDQWLAELPALNTRRAPISAPGASSRTSPRQRSQHSRASGRSR